MGIFDALSPKTKSEVNVLIWQHNQTAQALILALGRRDDCKRSGLPFKNEEKQVRKLEREVAQLFSQIIMIFITESMNDLEHKLFLPDDEARESIAFSLQALSTPGTIDFSEVLAQRYAKLASKRR